MKKLNILFATIASIVVLASCADSGLDELVGYEAVVLGEPVEVSLSVDCVASWDSSASVVTRTEFEEQEYEITITDLWIICIDPNSGNILWSQYSDELIVDNVDKTITMTVPTTTAATTMIYIANSGNTDLLTGAVDLDDIYALTAAEITSSDECDDYINVVSGAISQDAITRETKLKEPTLRPIMALIDVYVTIPDDMADYIAFQGIQLRNVQPDLYYFAAPSPREDDGDITTADDGKGDKVSGISGLTIWDLFPNLGDALLTIDYVEDLTINSTNITTEVLDTSDKDVDKDATRYHCQYYAPVNRRDGTKKRDTQVSVTVRSNGKDMVYSFAESLAIEPGFNYIYNINLNGFDDFEDDAVANEMTQIIDYTPVIKNRTNCYIINPHDYPQIIYIPIDRINTFWGEYENDNNRTIDVEGDGSADADSEWIVETIWYDFTINADDVTDRTDVVQLERSVSPQTGYDAIKITIPQMSGDKVFDQAARGNWLIGVKRNEDATEYLWSWHIWITDYDPNDITAGYVDVNGDGVYESRTVTSGSIRHFEDGADMHIQYSLLEAELAPIVAARNADNTILVEYEAKVNNGGTLTDEDKADITVINERKIKYNDDIAAIQAKMLKCTVWENSGNYEDKWLMDRNIGEVFDEESNDSAATEERDAGRGILLYQFGRPTPFPRVGVAKGVDGNPFEFKVATSATNMHEGILHPDTFFLGGDNGHWHSDSNYTSTTTQESDTDTGFLWGDKLITGWGSNAKSIFDPSPLGWKVPNYLVWNAFEDLYPLLDVTVGQDTNDEYIATDTTYDANPYTISRFVTQQDASGNDLGYYCYGNGSNNHSHYSFRYYLDGMNNATEYKELESSSTSASVWSSTPGYAEDESDTGTKGYIFRIKKEENVIINDLSATNPVVQDGVKYMMSSEEGTDIGSTISINYDDLEPRASAHMVRAIMR
ncbi:MAG: hypothetical protein R3Y39_07955 [Rikenellaceae bacterium]